MALSKASRLPPDIPRPATVQSVPFLDLASELRNRVYFACLSVPGHISLRVLKRKGVDKAIAVFPSRLPIVTLLATCKLAHAEGTPILYGTNTFANYANPRVFPAFQKVLGANSLNFLRKIASFKRPRAGRSFSTLNDPKTSEELCELTVCRAKEEWYESDIVSMVRGVMRAIYERKGKGNDNLEEVLKMFHLKVTALRPTAEEMKEVRESEETVRKILRAWLQYT